MTAPLSDLFSNCEWDLFTLWLPPHMVSLWGRILLFLLTVLGNLQLSSWPELERFVKYLFSNVVSLLPQSYDSYYTDAVVPWTHVLHPMVLGAIRRPPWSMSPDVTLVSLVINQLHIWCKFKEKTGRTVQRDRVVIWVHSGAAGIHSYLSI